MIESNPGKEKPSNNVIFIDWGTTNVRAFLFDYKNRKVLDQRQSDKGIKFVPKDGYPEVFNELVRDWLSRARYTLMAGMVGSMNGWEEAQYVPLPASPLKVSEHIHRLTSMDDVYIVGGLSCHRADNTYDVIRGEEVQIIGLMAKLSGGKQLVCLPGTHSKWLEIDENSSIDSFTTVMSGDFFSAICAKTIMAMMLEKEQLFSPKDFLRGIEISARPGGIMSHMFTVRGAALFQQIDPQHIESMISGIIIGSEIYSMKEVYDTKSLIHVIGSDRLIEKYSLAFDELQMPHRIHSSSEMTLAGMEYLANTMAQICM
jgi:2-dehydro-3-deoxygalactonokinase